MEISVWIFVGVLTIGTISSTHARKNVLLMVSDDLRPQLASYKGPYSPYNYQTRMHTPNTDDLAAKSLFLSRAYVQQAMCSPSRSSFLTGRRPDTTHVYDLKQYFRTVGGNFTTIPQYFKEHGYTSVGIGKIFHPGYMASRRDDPPSWSVPVFHGSIEFEKKIHSWKAVPDRLLKKRPLRDDQNTNHAIQTLQRLAPAALFGEKPFFLALGFQKPHLPFVFPESMLQYYPECTIDLPDNPHTPVNMPSIAWNNFGGLLQYDDIKRTRSSGKMNTTFPDKTVKKLRRAYYSAVTYVDSLVGRVLSELDRLGLSNNTIIAFMGDHGFLLGEHTEWCKETNFELATHTPLMISIPGLTDRGIQTNQLTEFVDLFPTLVDAAGLPSLPVCPHDSADIRLCREGTSLLPLIKNPDVPIKSASFSQCPRKLNGQKKLMGYTIRTDTFRYTEWVFFNFRTYRPIWHRVHAVELYDHRTDPDENYNRSADYKYRFIASKLSKKLRGGWRQAINGARY